jgi:hypothetical protein
MMDLRARIGGFFDGQVDGLFSAMRSVEARRFTGNLIRVVYDRDAYLKLPFARRALPRTGGSGAGYCLGIW